MRTLFLAATALAVSAPAFAAPQLTPSERYVRYRAAEAAGQLDTASQEMSALLTGPAASSDEITRRAYRQGIASGDWALALKAGHLLEQQKDPPPDAPLLFAADAIRAKDWNRARAQTEKLEQGKLFAFMVPLINAWIAQAAGDIDPLTVLERAKGMGLASGYYASERIVLLAAMGKVDHAAAELRQQQASGSRLKLLVASAFLAANRKADALAMLDGDDQPIVAARARIASGKPLGIAINSAAGGVSDLLAQVSVDFARQRLVPVGTVMARIATFVDPGNSSSWVATASLLGADKKERAGIAALGHIRPDDPFAQDAKTMRVSLLMQVNDKNAALAEAMAETKTPEADATDWARAGDVYLALDRPKEAAAVYAKAVALASSGPAEQLWPLLMQQGSALEQTDDWAGAKAALMRAASLAPNQPSILNHLGYSLLSRREDIAHASALIAKASQLRPDDPAITDSSGWAHFVSGDIEGALPLLETAAEGDPADPTINEHLGDVYWTAGRRIEARYAWRAASIGAEDKDLARLRAKIQDGLTKATASP